MSEYRYLSDHIGFAIREIGKGIRLAFMVTFVLVVIANAIKLSLILLGWWPA